MTSPGKFEASGEGPRPKLGDCATCKNKVPDSPTCLAFPNGIPRSILDGDVRHTRSYPGDNGITYDPDPERVAELEAIGWL